MATRIDPKRKTSAAARPQPQTDEMHAPAGQLDGRPAAPLRQAYRDILRGVQDTSRADEAQRSYMKLKR